MDNLKAGLEAILFTCDEPITLGKLKDIFPDAKPEEIRGVLAELRTDYEQTGRAFSLEEIAGGYQLLTRPQHADIIAKLKKAKADRKLSAAALETLAIIAYKQPIKRVDLEAIRGAASGELIRAIRFRRRCPFATFRQRNSRACASESLRIPNSAVPRRKRFLLFGARHRLYAISVSAPNPSNCKNWIERLNCGGISSARSSAI